MTQQHGPVHITALFQPVFEVRRLSQLPMLALFMLT